MIFREIPYVSEKKDSSFVWKEMNFSWFTRS